MTKRRSIMLATGALFMLIAFCPVRGEAGVHVGVGISLPVFTFSAPPPLVVIPGTYAYFVPDVGVEVFFYHGYWYRAHEGRWFRAKSYNGPWGHVVSGGIPGVLLHLSPDYRHVGPDHRRIPYGQLRKNWKTWERERYWDRHDTPVGGHGPYDRRDRR